MDIETKIKKVIEARELFNELSDKIYAIAYGNLEETIYAKMYQNFEDSVGEDLIALGGINKKMVNEYFSWFILAFAEKRNIVIEQNGQERKIETIWDMIEAMADEFEYKEK